MANISKRNKAWAAMVLALAAVGIVFLNEPGRRAEADEKPAAAPAPPPFAVGVVTLKEQPVQIWSEFSGRMEAVNYADVRPEVGGRITEIRFRDGETVKGGRVLFVIDPKPFEAAVAKAQGSVASAQAGIASAQTNAEFAKTEFDRAAGMIKTQAIAQRIYDERANTNRMAQAAIQSAQAAIQSAQAELQQAKIDLDHAYVKAPFTGRVSRAEITVGNLVQSFPTAPVLTTIVSTGGIYADFEVDEQTYMQTIRTQANTQDAERNIPVALTIPGDSEHSYGGTIYSFDNHIDSATGTIRARARFENQDNSLVPGMFVTVKLASNSGKPVLLVPERALGYDQNKEFVYAVGADNKVIYKPVQLGQQLAGRRIVTAGLQAGDRIVVDGTQHIRPDMVVQPEGVPDEMTTAEITTTETLKTTTDSLKK